MLKFQKIIDVIYFDGDNFYNYPHETTEDGITYITMDNDSIRSCITPCYIFFNAEYNIYLWQNKISFESEYTPL